MPCLDVQSCLTLCNPMNCIAHQASLCIGILQARILEWVVVPSSRRSSQPRDRNHVSMLQLDSLLSEPPGKPRSEGWGPNSVGLVVLLGEEVKEIFLSPSCETAVYQSERGLASEFDHDSTPILDFQLP